MFLKYFLVLCKFFFCEGLGVDFFSGGLIFLVVFFFRVLIFGVIVCVDCLWIFLLEFLNRLGGVLIIWGCSVGGCCCCIVFVICLVFCIEVCFLLRERVWLRLDEFKGFDNCDVFVIIERVKGLFESFDVLGKDNVFEVLVVDFWGFFEWLLFFDLIFKDEGLEFCFNVEGFDDYDVLEWDDELLVVLSFLWIYVLFSGIDEVESKGDVLEGLDDIKENLEDVGCEIFNDLVRVWLMGDLVLIGDYICWVGEDFVVVFFFCWYSL